MAAIFKALKLINGLATACCSKVATKQVPSLLALNANKLGTIVSR